MTSHETRRTFLRLLRRARAPRRAQFAAGAAQRPDAAVRQRRDEPVQGRVHRPRAARLRPGRVVAEVPARLGQAQRPGDGRTHAAAPHLLRDAGQLLVRRLLQGRGDRLRLGTDHARSTVFPTDRLWVTVFGGTDAFAADDEALAIWRDRDRRAGRANPATGREGQLLAHGRHRAVRAVQRDPLRPRRGPDLGRRGVERRRPTSVASSRSGTWSSCSSISSPTVRALPLPAPSIDTGMGLERIASVLQGKRSNYDTDLFVADPGRRGATGRRAATARTPRPTSRCGSSPTTRAPSASSSADGVVPANDKRGYVLRRLLRRAIRHGRKLGIDEPFLHEVTPVVIDGLGEVYPELLAAARRRSSRSAGCEEQRFAETLSTGPAGARGFAGQAGPTIAAPKRRAARQGAVPALRHVRLPARSGPRHRRGARGRARRGRIRGRDGASSEPGPRPRGSRRTPRRSPRPMPRAGPSACGPSSWATPATRLDGGR